MPAQCPNCGEGLGADVQTTGTCPNCKSTITVQGVEPQWRTPGQVPESASASTGSQTFAKVFLGFVAVAVFGFGIFMIFGFTMRSRFDDRRVQMESEHERAVREMNQRFNDESKRTNSPAPSCTFCKGTKKLACPSCARSPSKDCVFCGGRGSIACPNCASKNP